MMLGPFLIPAGGIRFEFRCGWRSCTPPANPHSSSVKTDIQQEFHIPNQIGSCIPTPRHNSTRVDRVIVMAEYKTLLSILVNREYSEFRQLPIGLEDNPAHGWYDINAFDISIVPMPGSNQHQIALDVEHQGSDCRS